MHTIEELPAISIVAAWQQRHRLHITLRTRPNVEMFVDKTSYRGLDAVGNNNLLRGKWTVLLVLGFLMIVQLGSYAVHHGWLRLRHYDEKPRGGGSAEPPFRAAPGWGTGIYPLNLTCDANSEYSYLFYNGTCSPSFCNISTDYATRPCTYTASNPYGSAQANQDIAKAGQVSFNCRVGSADLATLDRVRKCTRSQLRMLTAAIGESTRSQHLISLSCYSLLRDCPSICAANACSASNAPCPTTPGAPAPPSGPWLDPSPASGRPTAMMPTLCCGRTAAPGPSPI